jgi:hypothetical protein
LLGTRCWSNLTVRGGTNEIEEGKKKKMVVG